MSWRRHRPRSGEAIGLTIKAGGTGLTLTKSHHMLFVDLNWVPANNIQAEDRICRIGQDRGCLYKTLVANHEMDMRVHEILAVKMELIQATIKRSSEIERALPDVKELERIEEEQQQIRKEAADAAKAKAEELERKLQTGEARKCTDCGTLVEIRTAGPKAKNPGKKYFRCNKCGNFEWANQKPVSPELKTWTHRALQILAGSCDGARTEDGHGFNKFDTGFGKSLAYKSELTSQEVRQGRKMVQKYRGQLANAGHWPPPKN